MKVKINQIFTYYSVLTALIFFLYKTELAKSWGLMDALPLTESIFLFTFTFYVIVTLAVKLRSEGRNSINSFDGAILVFGLLCLSLGIAKLAGVTFGKWVYVEGIVYLVAIPIMIISTHKEEEV